MKAYGMELRERLLHAPDHGHSAEAVARQSGLSKRSVERYWARYQATGAAAAGKMGGHRRSKLAPHDATLREWIGQRPDLTLGELQQRCREQLKVRLGTTALWHRLERLGLSYKKRCAPPSNSGPTSRPNASAGGSGRRRGTPGGSCSSMKRA